MKTLKDKQIKLFTDISGDDKAYFHKDVKEAVLEYLEYLELSKPQDRYCELYQIIQCDINKFKKIFGNFRK